MAGLQDYHNYRYPYDPKEREFYEAQLRYQQQYQSPYPISVPQERGDFAYQSPRAIVESPEDDGTIRKYVGISVGIVSLITENLLSHPFLVLRRQCQVHNISSRYHLVPFTLIPVIVHLHQRQGLTTLWKGIGSVLMVRGMTLAVEDLVSKITPWPKEINANHTLKSVGQHILLKCLSLAVVMPFYSASLVETVQSDIASEKPGLLDVFREGACRLLAWGVPQKGRMLPVWALIGPTVTFGICKYVFSTVVRGVSSRLMQAHYNRTQIEQGAINKESPQSITQDIELNATLLSIMFSDILFYPFETIIHRLHLQGTRTIIDNLDSGYSVVAILTNYEGAGDCYESAISTEGFSGLYKGFGALVLQFAAHIAVIKLTKWILVETTSFLTQNSAVTPVPSKAVIDSADTNFSNLDPQSYLIN